MKKKIVENLKSHNLPYHRKERIYVKRTVSNEPVVTIIPMRLEQKLNGDFIMEILWDRAAIEKRRKIFKGWHNLHTIVHLQDRRLIMRKILE